MADLVEKVILKVEVTGKESIDQAAQAGERLAATEEKITRAKRTTLDGLERMMASYDRQTRLIQQMGSALERLQRYETEGVGTTERRRQVFEKLSDSFNRQIAAIDGISARLTQLQAKFDPATTSARQMTVELAELNAAQKAGINIAGGYESAWNGIIAKYDQGAAAATRAKEAQDALGRSQERITRAGAATNGNGLNFFGGGPPGGGGGGGGGGLGPGGPGGPNDPRVLIQAARQAQQAENAIKDAAAAQAHFNQLLGVGQRAGAPSRADWVAQFEQGASAAQKSNTALRGFNQAQGEAVVGSRQLGFLMTNLTFQINDVVTGLASGQGVFRVFAQQGGQIFQIFQLGGRQLVAGILSWITPMTAAVAAFAAFGAVLAVGVARAFAIEDALRKFSVTLDGVSRSSEATAEDLFTVQRRLQAIGLSADEANKAIGALRANPNINRAAIGQIALTGADVGARLGVSSAEGIQQLNTAIKGGVSATLDFGFALDAITLKQARSIQETARQGNQVKALNDALKLISQTLTGEHERSLSSMEKATNSMTESWNRMLDAFAKTSIVQGAKAAIESLLNGMASAFNTAANAMATSNAEFQSRQAAALAAPRAPGVPMAGERARLGGASTVTGAGAGTNEAGINELSDQVGKLNQTLIEGAKLTQEALRMRIVVPQPDQIGLGRHAPDSFHYRGGALDFNIVDPASGRVYTHAEAQQPGPAQDAYILYGALYQKIVPTQGGAGMNFEGSRGSGRPDYGHIDIGGVRGPFTDQMASRARELGVDKIFQDYIARGGRVLGASPDAGSGIPRRPDSQTAPSGDLVRSDSAAISKNQEAIDAANKSQQDAIRIAKERAIQLAYDTRYTEVYTEAVKQQIPGWQAEQLAQAEAGKVRGVMLENIKKENEERSIEITGIGRTVEAFKQSEAAGYREEAAAQARLETLNSGNNTALVQQQILDRNAGKALQQGQQAVAAAAPQINAAEKIAAAAKNGAAAQREAEIAAQAGRQTQDAVARAEASRNPILIAQAEALQKVALSEAMRNEKAKVSLANQEALNAEIDNRRVLGTQLQTVGQLPEVQQAALNNTRLRIELEKQGVFSSKEDKDARLASLAATEKMNIALAQANREQQRLEDGVRSVASAVENELTKSIEAAFSGEKVESWGVRLKKMLGSIAAGISDALFIKPLLGTLASAIAPNVGAQLGTFGNLFGGGSSGTQTLTGTVGGQPATFNIQNLSGGANILDKVFSNSGGGSGGSVFGNIGGSINNFLGNPFASTIQLPAMTSSELSSFGNLIGIDATRLGNIGIGQAGSFTVPGNLFGFESTATLGGFLGGAGAGFGAGTLLNSLVGGSRIGGTAGSAVGSLAGAAIGSIIPGVGTLIGGLIGGAGGGLLGGLFGSNKPPNQLGGANINLQTGRVVTSFQGGNQQLDQQVQQLSRSIGQFATSITSLSGGTLDGAFGITAGVNTGIKARSSVPGLSGEFSLGKDPQEALRVTQLGLVKALSGVSDTMRKVIDQITDAEDIQNALTFAKTYEELKKSFDNAFSGIAQDAKVVGPFSLALDQLNATFKDLTENANKFGLSLDPINAGLAESKKRLNESFELFIKQQEIGATGNAEFLSPAFAAHQQFLQNINDAKSLGLESTSLTGRISKIEQDTLREQFKGLTRDQLQIVIDTFKKLAPEVSDFAKTMLATAGVINQVTDSTENLYASLVQLREQLTTGPSSGLTAAEQLKAANDNFNTTAAAVRFGDTTKIGELSQRGSALIALAEQTYGNAPQTAAIRKTILDAINAILSAVGQGPPAVTTNVIQFPKIIALPQGFATGTRSTPPGMILVGERGPELLTQPGGFQVFNNLDTEAILASPPTNRELISKLDMVISLLSSGNVISREHGAVSQRGFAQLSGAVAEGNQPTFEPPVRRKAS